MSLHEPSASIASSHAYLVGGTTDSLAIQVPPCNKLDPRGRLHVGVANTVPEGAFIHHIESQITTSSMSPLCGESQQTTFAYDTVSAAFAGIFRAITSTQPHYDIWAHVGYMKVRDAKKLTIQEGPYCELSYSPTQALFKMWVGDLLPGHYGYSATHIGQALNKWEFRLMDGSNDLKLHSFTHPAWQGVAGEQAQWMGEITHVEDKLAGIESDRCAFSDCKICANWDPNLCISNPLQGIPVIYLPPGVNPGTAEYGTNKVSDNKFEIWDKNLQ